MPTKKSKGTLMAEKTRQKTNKLPPEKRQELLGSAMKTIYAPKPKKNAFTLIELIIVIAILGILASLIMGAIGGCHTNLPKNTVIATITKTYVDKGGDDDPSHYMVGTDKGVFEVQNGISLGIWNADEIFSSLKDGHTYRLETKGVKSLTWYSQNYPFIISATEVDTNR